MRGNCGGAMEVDVKMIARVGVSDKMSFFPESVK